MLSQISLSLEMKLSTLTQLVGLVKLMFSIVHRINAQGREPCLHDFIDCACNSGSRSDAYELNTFLMEYIQLSCLPTVKYFGLRVYRNVQDKESSFTVSLKKDLHLLCKFGMTCSDAHEPEM